MPRESHHFSTDQMTLILREEDACLCFEQLSTRQFSWLHSPTCSALFLVQADGRSFTAANLAFDGVEDVSGHDEVQHLVLGFHHGGLRIDYHLKIYAETALVECLPVVINQGEDAIRVDRIDSISFSLVNHAAELLAFTGDWGSEFEPRPFDLLQPVVLESRSGRSSKGNHPWFALTQSDGNVFSASVAWSGNWVLRLEPQADASIRVSGGLHDWEFFKTLQPGEQMEGAPVVIVLGDDLNHVSRQYARVGRQHWYPSNEWSARLPIEWNHWWPYEDAEIDEQVFARNVEAAGKLGFEVCTLDAGWFGPSAPDTFWYDYRGDWHLVNDRRFPEGIRWVAEQTHARQMKFGLWCEIEGLGVKARLALEHPDFPAERGGERLGYVCFGNPQAQEWAYQTLSRLIREYGCDWIKLDFNLDPGAGCDRTDHGHQAGDGLYEHYRGYYRVLERVRRDFPGVVLENCSSGGLRIDLGMMRRVYMTFLSDPDWAVHDLQIFWGASTMLAPNVLLHWTFSQWRGEDPPPYQTFDPRDPALTLKKWDYYTRISMLGLYGLSQKLPDLPDWLAKRVMEQNQIYQKYVRRFVKEADLYRLTQQPLRGGGGDRWAGFQYSLPDQSEHLVFVFRLPGAEPDRVIRLQNLQADRLYAVDGLEGEWGFQQSGASLMRDGLRFNQLEEEDSALLLIH
ncbi:MAG: alpha-galactosidase [Anaerolineaceae bacterium]|nr:alpha-galactosidase [Anaerolineaceae bacterium]